MRILVAPTFSPIKGGIEARSPLLRLVGHGSDSDSASASLARAVRAWCVGLAAAGDLESALRRHGVRWDQAGEGIEVEVETALQAVSSQ
jgi:hypothetical protein